MSITEPAKARAQMPSNDCLEALGRTLQHAFPISECHSFAGLMDAIGADRNIPSEEDEPFLLQAAVRPAQKGAALETSRHILNPSAISQRSSGAKLHASRLAHQDNLEKPAEDHE